MNKKTIIVSIVSVLALGLLSFVIIKKIRKPSSVLLLGGLDNRSGDLDINQQVELVNKGLNNTKNIQGFRYNDLTGILSAINNSTKPMIVILFSAGGSKSKEVAMALKQKGFSLNNMFVLEPYAKSSKTSASIKEAVRIGVPAKNVMVGKSKSTGLGVVNNATSTPSCSPNHWCSLTEIGKIIK